MRVKLLILLTILLPFEMAFACHKHMEEQLTNLFDIFKDGAQQGYKYLNKRGDGLEVTETTNSYVCCYEKQGDKMFRVASTKSVLKREEVTDDKEVMDIVTNAFFANANSEKYIPYTYKNIRKEAKIIDVHNLDKSYESGKAICAVIGVKDKKK